MSPLATGVVAILALPIRDGLQRAVSRLMYGDRDDLYRALARLGHRLESTIEPERIPTVDRGQHRGGSATSVRRSRSRPAGCRGARRSSRATRPGAVRPGARPRADVVGRLLLGQRTGDQRFSAADLRLLDHLARGAGAAVHSTRRTLDLLGSRERLVTAREEEPPAPRRDLHDGSAALAAIGLRAEAANELLDADSTSARAQPDELRLEASRALADIRRRSTTCGHRRLTSSAWLVRSVSRPLRCRARREPAPGSPVRPLRRAWLSRWWLRAGLPVLPAAIEVAAYRIAVEALTNTARHANARRCSIRSRPGAI